MAWTSPKTWNVGELVTAGLLNTHLRDNLNALKAPPFNWVALPTGLTTTSTTPVDITGASVTFTTAGGDIRAYFTGAVTSTAGTAAAFRLVIDGTPTSTLSYVSLTGASVGTVAMVYRFAATAGSHTVKVQWNTTSANAIFLNLANSVFIAGEFS